MFLEPTAAQLLDDKALHAAIDEQGQVQFALAERCSGTVIRRFRRADDEPAAGDQRQVERGHEPGRGRHDGLDRVHQPHGRGLEPGRVVVAVGAEQLQVERVVRLAADLHPVAALPGRLRPVRARGRDAAG